MNIQNQYDTVVSTPILLATKKSLKLSTSRSEVFDKGD